MDLVAPKVGLMEAVTVLQWQKEAGERIAFGETLVVLETDKANVELDSPIAGWLARILVPPGTVVTPGQVLAEITPDEIGPDQQS